MSIPTDDVTVLGDDQILIQNLKLLKLDTGEIKKIVKMKKDSEYKKIYQGSRPIDIPKDSKSKDSKSI